MANDDVEVVRPERVVVTALPLAAEHREALSELLGDGTRIVDIREAVDGADIVLSPPCSPRLIAGLGNTFPGARIVVVEIEDWQRQIDLGGPVQRLQQAGADAYLVVDSLEELAEQIAAPRRPLPDPPSIDAGAADNLIEASLEALARTRAEREIDAERKRY